MRSNTRSPGLAPSQVTKALDLAANEGGAHLLVMRGREKQEEALVSAGIAPYFRIRWVNGTLLKLIPHAMDRFFEGINQVLSEELEWTETVKPQDESCCLLLPECAFSAAADVRHVWSAALESGLERIRLAARASKQFEIRHWLSHRNGPRAWIDDDDKVFDHRGARHGLAPFPRSWKLSYQLPLGFHFDITSKVVRAFRVQSFDGGRHDALGSGHVNIDPHGYVRI